MKSARQELSIHQFLPILPKKLRQTDEWSFRSALSHWSILIILQGLGLYGRTVLSISVVASRLRETIYATPTGSLLSTSAQGLTSEAVTRID
jgi:hypothetical protein